jgi:hypothetical protein
MLAVAMILLVSVRLAAPLALQARYTLVAACTMITAVFASARGR